MHLHFTNAGAESTFFRRRRLIHDDLCSYASAAAPYCALNEQADNTSIVEKLNANAMFWNCILASFQTTAIVSLARLHDKKKENKHFERYIDVMSSQNSDCAASAQLLQAAIANQTPFIEKILNLRNNLFAHTNVDAPLIAAFGFEGIKVDDFRAYWNEMLSAMEACDLAAFGTREHGPKFEKSLFLSFETATRDYFVDR
jgi:hypothetical protein